MSEELSDKDILDTVIGAISVREMTAITFIHWVAKNLNNVEAQTAASVELSGLVSNPPISRFMPEEEKCRIYRKVQLLKKV